MAGYLDGKDRQTLAALVSQLRFLNAPDGPIDRRVDANFPELGWMKKLFLEAGYQTYYDEAFYLYELML